MRSSLREKLEQSLEDARLGILSQEKAIEDAQCLLAMEKKRELRLLKRLDTMPGVATPAVTTLPEVPAFERKALLKFPRRIN